MSSVIQLSIFASRLNAVCDEMGASLQRSAFSPNIKDRLDFSCAIFDTSGELCAQAAHIPVHLGSMAFAMVNLVQQHEWLEGDVLVVNDPYQGGTHLPDVTVIAPVFSNGKLLAFTANRAHHANIGSTSPGSMPIARSLEEEGIVISPTFIQRQNQWCDGVMSKLTDGRSDAKAQGDFLAQIGAAKLGALRMGELIDSQGREAFSQLLQNLNQYAEQLAVQHWRHIPDGIYSFTDVMDDDGLGNHDIPIKLVLTVRAGKIIADFDGTAKQVEGNINCPLSVAAAAVYYCLRCLLPEYAPACAGTFRPITLQAPKGCLLNAEYPAAVAAGNVETSSRVVDVVFGALAQALPEEIPAASQGTMNNLAMGSAAQPGQSAWDYYETLAGGCGAGPHAAGLSARHSHMTNTLNTPIESVESHFPIQVKTYQLRRGSGGAGVYPGGNGVVREYQYTAPASVTLLTERRTRGPWGLWGAGGGKAGKNYHNDREIPGKVSLDVAAGDLIRIETPGGGGWNSPPQKE